MDDERVVRGVLFPVTDPAASVDDTLALVRSASLPTTDTGR
ncbi:MAG: hypothetical protein ACRDPJ_20160 [Nocardioidaceae bacterium]